MTTASEIIAYYPTVSYDNQIIQGMYYDIDYDPLYIHNDLENIIPMNLQTIYKPKKVWNPDPDFLGEYVKSRGMDQVGSGLRIAGGGKKHRARYHGFEEFRDNADNLKGWREQIDEPAPEHIPAQQRQIKKCPAPSSRDVRIKRPPKCKITAIPKKYPGAGLKKKLLHTNKKRQVIKNLLKKLNAR